MSKIFGYARISRKEQSIERQIRNIKTNYPDAIIYQEAFTGTKIEGRAQLDKLLKVVCSGDTIVFDSVSRMSRNAAEGFELYQKLFNDGVELVFLKEIAISTNVFRAACEKQIDLKVKTGRAYMDKAFNRIIEIFNDLFMDMAKESIQIAFEQAQKEVDDLHQRTREGIETARLAGKQIGQIEGSKLNVKKEAPAKEVIRKHYKAFGGTLNGKETAKLAGISWNTFKKYLAELETESK